MAVRTLPGLGLTGGWAENADGWGDPMNENLRVVSALVQLSVISSTTSLPGSPSDGDIYIVPSADANGNDVAIRDEAAWVYITPLKGWLAYARDTETIMQFNGTAWVELETGGGGIPDAPADGNLYGRKNNAWAVVPEGGGSGGPGGSYAYVAGATGTVGTASSAGNATKGGYFIPSKDIIVTHIWAFIDAAASGEDIYGQIAEVSDTTPSSQVVSILGTTETEQTVGTDMYVYRLPFATPVVMRAGVPYAVVAVNASGTDTTAMRIGANSGGDSDAWHMNAPGEHVSAAIRYTSVGLSTSQSPDAQGTGMYLIAIEGWVSVPPLAQISEKTADHTLALEDTGTYIRMDVAGANTVTVPAEASVDFEIGSTVAIRQVGAGQTTIVADTGVTINSAETLKLRKQGSTVTLTKVGADEWDLTGDLEAL